MPFDLDWELRLEFLIHDIARLRREVVDCALKPLGLTRPQWFLLVYAARSQGVPQVTLAEQMDIGKVAVGVIIDKLEAAGLVERRADKSDRRLKLIYLTDQGHSVIASIRAMIGGEEDRILQNLDEKDLNVTVRTLRIMKLNLSNMIHNQ